MSTAQIIWIILYGLLGLWLIFMALTEWWKRRINHRNPEPPLDDYPTSAQEDAMAAIAWEALRTGKTISGNISPEGEIFNLKKWEHEAA